VQDNLLILQNVRWPAEIRIADFDSLKEQTKLDAKELAVATQLVEMMSGPFDASEYTDTYAEQVAVLIEAKATGQPTVRKDAAPVADVSNLLAALEATVKAKAASKAAHPAGKKIGKAPAKAAPRKAAPRKTA
jgi:DNA end-binding protein Ku